VYPQVMTDPETTPAPPPDAAQAAEATLSTKVDQALYDWFVEHAKANFRNLSGQLAYVIHHYRDQVETRESFVDAIERHQGLPRPIRVGRPYVGEPDPNVRVTWDQAVPTPDPIDDDPEEGVA
jgi:hypothetical protein